MDLLSYQRTVFAFHGCDRRLRDAVLTGKTKLMRASTPTTCSAPAFIPQRSIDFHFEKNWKLRESREWSSAEEVVLRSSRQ